MVLYAHSDKHMEGEREYKQYNTSMGNLYERSTKQTCTQSAGSVWRTRILFAGMISPMICGADEPN